MKVTVITGSPHKKGTSALLAEKFIEGANQAGHEIFRFDAAFERVAPCQGCDYCRRNDSCFQKDDMANLNPALLAADVIVFVTPLYYFGMSAQLKAVIDRFYEKNDRLMGGKKALLLATAYDDKDWTMQALVDHYRTVLRYLQWEDLGTLLAVGCGGRSDIERTDFPERARQLGRNLK